MLGSERCLLLSATRSARISIELTGLDHIDSNSYVLLYGPLLQARFRRPARDSAIARKAAIYRAMVETSRWFLTMALDSAAPVGEDGRRALEAKGPVWDRVPGDTSRVRSWPAKAK